MQYVLCATVEFQWNSRVKGWGARENLGFLRLVGTLYRLMGNECVIGKRVSFAVTDNNFAFAYINRKLM
jgi:hypothetical protein